MMLVTKEEVRKYWNDHTCETDITQSEKYSRKYFDEIEEYRNYVTPSIKEFADFDSWKNKKVLEIGVGAGTDFIQFAKAGADIYGMDLTEEAVKHVEKRLQIYGLKGTASVGDAENLKFKNNEFDLVYSFGVLHHTPDIQKAIGEAIRVAKSGGRIKLMLYNRKSLMSLWVWLRGIYTQKRYVSLKWAWSHGKESVGTQAFTQNEVKNMLSKYPVKIISITSKVNRYDYLFKYHKAVQVLVKLLIKLLGDNSGYFMFIELEKS